jgi:hypothetical protein
MNGWMNELWLARIEIWLSHIDKFSLFYNILPFLCKLTIMWRICSRQCWATARWARSNACATQQYCERVSFVPAHGPLLYNAWAGDITQQCVGITWHVFLLFVETSDSSSGHMTSFLWRMSVPRLYSKVPSITARQLAIRDSHGKFVVEEELEVSLWRFNMWFEDFWVCCSAVILGVCDLVRLIVPML